MLALDHCAFAATPSAMAAGAFFPTSTWIGCGSPHADIYRIRELSERELLQTYIALLSEACVYADSDWKIRHLIPKPATGAME